MFRNFTPPIVALAFGGLVMGCAPTMKQESGFLSDYSKLEKVDDNYSRWKDPNWTKGSCTRMIVDPIQFNLDPDVEGKFTEEERREIREYVQVKFTEVLARHVEIVTQPGPGVCRARIALTDIEKSNALLNIWPATRATGAGRGGAAVEAEVIDTESGKVIGMDTRRATGKFFEGHGLTDLGDIKAAIDLWAKDEDKAMAQFWWGDT